jgi:hypothetical protein
MNSTVTRARGTAFPHLFRIHASQTSRRATPLHPLPWRPFPAPPVRTVPARRASGPLLDHLGGLRQDRRWNRQAQRPGGLQVDDQVELRGLLHRQVAQPRGQPGASRCPGPLQGRHPRVWRASQSPVSGGWSGRGPSGTFRVLARKPAQMLAKSAKKREPEVTYHHEVESRTLKGIARGDSTATWPGDRSGRVPAPWLSAGVEAQGEKSSPPP